MPSDWRPDTGPNNISPPKRKRKLSIYKFEDSNPRKSEIKGERERERELRVYMYGAN